MLKCLSLPVPRANCCLRCITSCCDNRLYSHRCYRTVPWL